MKTNVASPFKYIADIPTVPCENDEQLARLESYDRVMDWAGWFIGQYGDRPLTEYSLYERIERKAYDLFFSDDDGVCEDE